VSRFTDDMIYTRNGLKVRFNEEAMKPVIWPLVEAGQYDDILMDIELWVNLPNAVSSVAAIAAAFVTGSWAHILVFWLLGMLVGGVVQEAIYSEALKVIFPMFLGGWLIALPGTIACDIYLVLQGGYVTAVVLTLLVVGNWLHMTDCVFLLPLMPFQLWLMALVERRTGVPVGFTLTERVFVTLCERRAKKLGIELQWELYDQAMRDRRQALDSPLT